MAKKTIRAINMSDKTEGEMNELLSSKAGQLAISTAHWIGSRYGIYVALGNTHDGVFTIDFQIPGQNDPHPTLKVVTENGDTKVKWPKGSDFDLLMSFMEGKP